MKKKLFSVLCESNGSFRDVVLCYFHAKQTKLGGCGGRIKETPYASECCICAAFKVAKEREEV